MESSSGCDAAVTDQAAELCAECQALVDRFGDMLRSRDEDHIENKDLEERFKPLDQAYISASGGRGICSFLIRSHARDYGDQVTLVVKLIQHKVEAKCGMTRFICSKPGEDRLIPEARWYIDLNMQVQAGLSSYTRCEARLLTPMQRRAIEQQCPQHLALALSPSKLSIKSGGG